MTTWSFLVMQTTSSTHLFHHGVGMGHRGPSACSSKYSIQIFAMTGETGEPIAVPWSCLKLLLEWEHTVIQHKFQDSNNFVLGNAMGMFQEVL